MRAFAPLAVGVFAAVVSIFSAGSVSAAPQTKSTVKSSPIQKVYVVKVGDTLTSIGEKYKVSYTRLFDANTQIADPNVIDVGDKVKIPKKTAKFAHRNLAGTATVAVAYSSSNNNVQYASKTTVAASAPAGGGVWDRIAQCESGGNWSINTGNGYSGGLQFDSGTWGNYKRYASAAQAPRGVQIERAGQIRAGRGGSYSAWPACSAKLGLS